MSLVVLATALIVTASPALQAGSGMSGLHRTSASVGCQIQATGDGSGTKLDAVVTTSGPVTGTYQFEVDRMSDGSNIERRSGEFSAEKEGRTTVANLELPAGEGYKASLSVEWPGGSSSCSSSVS